MLYFTKTKYDCTGCGACSAVCPVNCITFVRDGEGFDYPIADSRCINCGNCERVCPIMNNEDLFYTENVQKSFAGRHQEDAIWEKSASGGAFTAICNAYCNSGDVIYGAKFDGTEVIHDYIKSVENIGPFRKSKYVQSNMQNSYKEIKNQLLQGHKILFSGTPCQIAGIRNYLGKTYANLLCVDLVCHGVASPGVFERYISYIEDKYKEKVKSYTFRGKKAKLGKLLQHVITIEFQSGKKVQFENDLFNTAFIQTLLIRPSCSKCRYAKLQRVGDLTIADFKNKHELLPDAKGLDNFSTIIVNTDKGQQVLEKLKSMMKLYSVDIIDIQKTNPPIRNASVMNKSREEFFRDLNNLDPIDRILKKYISKPKLIQKLWLGLPDRVRGTIKRRMK
jgi:coenzyme F420-reducing hydrogenase beta subunit